MKHDIHRLVRESSGATAIEYGLIAGGIAIAISLAVFTLGGAVNEQFAAGSQAASGPGASDPTVLSADSFEDVTGYQKTGWGYLGPVDALKGWTNTSGLKPEFIKNGYMGITGGDGDYLLDLGASPGNMTFQRAITDLADGQKAQLSFLAADPFGNNGIDVYWGSDLADSFDPKGRQMTEYSVDLVGGSGDGSNMLEIRGTGPIDNVGAAIDRIEVLVE